MTRSRILQFSLTVAGVAALVLGAPLLTQEQFDPTSVRPNGCNDQGYNCGYRPAPAQRLASIPVADSAQIRHRGLPSSADVSTSMPPVGNQGQQGSCVAWSSGYYLKSYHEKIERGWSYDSPVQGGRGDRVFSPAYIYNQINGGRDDGSYIHDALGLMVNRGAAPWSAMPYNTNDFRRQPTSAAHQQAGQYRAQSFRAIPGHQIDAIKAELAKGNPVEFGIPVDDGFYNLGSSVYDGFSGTNYGGHAILLVGYDDNKRSGRGHRGAFKLINSWGTSWGDRGYGWISYQHWVAMDPQVYVMYDRRDATNDEQEPTVDDVEDEVVTDGLDPVRQITASKGTFPNKVQISWSAVQRAVVYGVYRAEPTDQDDYEYIGYSQATSFDDTAVQQNVSYRYLVIAIQDEDIYSDPERSPTAEGHAGSGGGGNNQIGEVVGLSGTATVSGGRTIVRLNWSAAANANRYQVARYNSRSESWAVAGTSQTTTFEDRGASGAQIYYSVRAIGSGSASDWADPVEVRAGTPVPVVAPETPGSVTASRGTFRDKIRVTWDAVPGASKYFVFRYNYNSESWEGPAASTTTTLDDDDPSVARGGWFAYSIVANNSVGNSGYSTPVAGRANPNAQRGVELSPPENVRAQVENGRITITWDAVEKADEYYVFRREEGDDDYEFVSSSQSSAARSFSEVVPGDVDDLYFYVVRSKAALGGESENSQAVAGFRNRERSVVRHRFLPGQGFDRFEGNWSGRYWDGAGAPGDVTVKLRLDGDKFVAQVQYADRQMRTFRGDYIAMSGELKATGFEMRLNPDLENGATVSISSTSVAGKPIHSAGLVRSE